MAPITRSRAGKSPSQQTTPTEPRPASEDSPAPARRSQRLIQRGNTPDTAAPTTAKKRTSAASCTADAAAASTTASPVPPKPLRRAAAGRRAAERPAKRVRREPQLSGLWDLLPTELLDMILDRCGPHQLARLETTCSYFKTVKKLDGICQERLKTIPRAKGMEPNRG
jgi:hypothetical protein